METASSCSGAALEVPGSTLEDTVLRGSDRSQVGQDGWLRNGNALSLRGEASHLSRAAYMRWASKARGAHESERLDSGPHSAIEVPVQASTYRVEADILIN